MKMNLTISGGWVPAYKIGEFVKKMGGPKITDFSSVTFGSTINFISIDLESQNPEKPFRNRTQDRNEDGWLIFHIVLDEEVKAHNQNVINRQIIQTILNVLSKSFRRWKVPDFDADGFLKELTLWFDRKLNESNNPEC